MVTFEKLRIKIASRYPIISIGSHEEIRVLVAIRALARTKGKQVWTWSLSDGLNQVIGDAKCQVACMCGAKVFLASEDLHRGAVCPDCKRQLPDTGPWVFDDKSQINPDDYQDPSAALRFIRHWPVETSTLFVFLGLGQIFIDPAGNVGNVMIARLLKDISNEFPTSENTLILVDPTIVCPASLANEIAVLDWPLPDAAESEQIIEQAAKAGKVVADLQNGTKEKLVRALAGMTFTEQVSVLSEAVVSTHKLDASAHTFVLAEKEQAIRKSGFMTIMRPSQVSDAGGLDLVKRARQIALSTFSQGAAAFGADRARQFLFAGLPGSGKSLAAGFFAGDEMTLADADMSDLKGKYVGDTEKNTRLFFQLLVSLAPICVRLDEFEKLFGGVQDFNGDSGATKGQFGKFLTFAEENTSPVLMICTANWPEQLPPEAISRFDEVFFFGEPTFGERVDILSIHLAKHGCFPEAYDLNRVASLAHGYVGRELKRVVVKATQRCWFEDKRPLTNDDLLDYVRPGSPVRVKPLTEIMPDRCRAIREWGEKHATSPASSQSALAPFASDDKAQAERKLEMG